jgi:hypothetical protein
VLASQIEMLSWGDVGCISSPRAAGLGAAAVQAAGTPEQKARFLARFGEEKPTLAAMCMTEAGAGSDTASIRTRAVLDENTKEWVLNGEKIFVTSGDKSFTEYENLAKASSWSGHRSTPRRTGRDAGLCRRIGDAGCAGCETGAQTGHPCQ